MSLFDVSVITTVDSFFENLATNSCCGASIFVKKLAKAVNVMESDQKKKFLEQLSVAPDGQLDAAWRNKALELLGEP